MTTTVLTKFATRMILKGELFVHLTDLPSRVRAAYCSNLDGSFSVFINAKHSTDRQRQALFHEISHIYHKDLSRDIEADVLETERRL